MFVITLVVSQAWAGDWTRSGFNGTPGMVAGFDSVGQPINMDPVPFTTTIVQSVVPSVVNAAIQAQVPAMCVDSGEAALLIDAAILTRVPAMSLDAAEASVLIDAAISSRVPAMSLDATEASVLINAAIGNQFPELALREIDENVPDLIDAAIAAQVPGICVEEIDARVPGMIDAAIAAQVPGMTLDASEAGDLVDAAIAAQVPSLSLDAAEAGELIDAAIGAQVPDICLEQIDGTVPSIVDAAILAQVPGLSLDASEAGALIDAAIAAQVPDICLDAIDSTVPALIDDAILDQVPDLALDEIDANVPGMIDDLAPPRTGLSFGTEHRIAWMLHSGSSTGTNPTLGNQIVFNLHVEETARRTYDQIQSIVSTATPNNTALALYALDPSGVPGDLLWSGPSSSGAVVGPKPTAFSAGTWTAAGADHHDAANDLVLDRGDEVLLAEHHSGTMTLRVFTGTSARALGANAATGAAFTGWELAIPTFGAWPASATAAVGRTVSPPVLSLRVKP